MSIEALKDIREKWDYFSNIEIVKSELHKKYGQIPDHILDRLALYFSYCIRQAKEYFHISENASSLTKPAILFYGLSALAKALVVATFGREAKDVLHGLTVRVVREEEEKEGTYSLSKEQVIIKEKGAFPNFQRCYATTPLRTGTRLTVKEIFSVLPDLKERYEQVYGERSRALTQDQIQAFQPAIKTVDISGRPIFITAIKKDSRYILVPELSSFYILMFILSMIVRYEPRKWGEILRKKEPDEATLVHRFIQVAGSKFPQLTFDEIIAQLS